MFAYAEAEHASNIYNACEEIFKDFKEKVKNSFLVDCLSFGINEHSLITKNIDTNEYDISYLIIINKDKTFLLDQPFYIKNIILAYLLKIKPECNFEFLNNDKSLIKGKFMVDDCIVNLDIIITYNEYGTILKKLLYNKWGSGYIWLTLRPTLKYYNRYEKLKEDGHYDDIANLYLIKKNELLELGNDNFSSLKILMDSFCDVWDKYYI